MARKRTPDQPSTEAEPTSATGTTELSPVETSEAKKSFVERIGPRRDWVSAPDPFGIASDNVAGVRLFESKRDRQMAIKFDEKPSEPVIGTLKEAGYRWNPTEHVWTHPVNRESAMSTRIEAERLYQEVRQMIRQEKGMGNGQEIPF